MVSLRGSCNSTGPPMNYAQSSAHPNAPVSGAPHVALRGMSSAGRQLAAAHHVSVSQRGVPVQNGATLLKHDLNSHIASNVNCMAHSHHYRMLSQGRAECYHPSAGTGGYMGPGVPAQSPNLVQGGMRGVPPASQSPVTTQPHNAQELNKQAMQAHNYVPTQPSPQQQQNRPQMFSSPYRTGATAPRPTSHLRQPTHSSPLYQGSTGGNSTQMIYPMLYQPHGVIPPQYHSTQQRPGCYPQNVIIHQNPYCINPYQQNQPPQPYYYQTASPLLAPTNMASPAQTGRNTTNLVASQGPPPAASGAVAPMQHPMPQTHMHQNMTAPRPLSVTQGQPLRKKRSFAITIKDPKTGEDVCADLFSEPSQPLSGESSERHTPQLETNSVAEEFSRMVIETLTQNTTPDTSAKPMLVSKSAEAPQAACLLNIVQSPPSIMNSSYNNNNMKSDTLPLTENKILGTDIAVEGNETPVVSAISDSPVIVPKLCPTVIKVQKSDSSLSAVHLDTNKNVSVKQNKQNKSKPVVPIPDEERIQSEVSAVIPPPQALQSASAPMPAPTFTPMTLPHPHLSHVPTHMPPSQHISMPTNVAAPPFVPAAAHSFVTAAAPTFVPAAAPTFAPLPAFVAAPAPAYVPSHAPAPAYMPSAPYVPVPAPVPAFGPPTGADPAAHLSAQSKNSVPVQVLDTEIVASPVQAAVPAPPPAPAPTAAVVLAPAPQMPPPRPQRPRKTSSESRNNRRDSSPHNKDKIDSSIIPSNLNGPQLPVIKNYPLDRLEDLNYVQSSQKRLPTSTTTDTASIQDGSEISVIKVVSVEVEAIRTDTMNESRTVPVLPTPTELLAASIECVATRATTEQEEDLGFSSASQAQAKLHQSLASCNKNKTKELIEKEPIIDSKTDNTNTKSQQATKETNDIAKTDKNEKTEVHSKIIENKPSAKIVRDFESGDDSDKAVEYSKNETETKIAKEQVDLPEPDCDEFKTKIDEQNTDPTVKPIILEKPTLKYNYKEDQWSPLNTDGRKCYDRDFLLQLQDDPQSKKEPENIQMLSAVMKSKSPEGYILPLNISRPSTESFLPVFAKSMTAKGPSRERERERERERDRDRGEPKKSSMLASKPSMKGSMGGGSNSSSGPNKNVIHVSLSLRSDVKLNESENAWKPTSRIKNSQLGGEDHQTQELYKKFRGILNKLTPQKFDRLLDQVKHLEINSQARLEGVIDLIFEKAIDEPGFSVAYAEMCHKLSKLMVLADNSSDQYVNFRALIISKCQAQFETTKVQEGILKLEKELADCTNVARKKEIHAMLEEENRKVRMRSVGNVRFIGELYKLRMLTSKIMLYCLNNLIDKLDEEKLECLCKLLTTIGQQVESEVKPQLDSIFKSMHEIVDRKSNKISSRVRFMLQDVIELRRNRWSSKHVIDAQPKTMDQIQKEAEHHQRQIEIMNSAPMGREYRRDDGGRGKRGGESRRAGANNFQDNWPSNKRPQQYQVDASKLKAATNMNKNLSNIKLGPPQQQSWNHGSGAKAVSQSPLNSITLPTTTNNMYSVLENANTDPASIRGSKENTSSYHSKGASIERSTFNSKSDFSGSKTGSSGTARSSSGSRSGGGGGAAHAPPEPPVPEPHSPAGDEPVPLTEQATKTVRASIDHSIITLNDEELLFEIKTKFDPNQHSGVVCEILNYALEKSPKTYPQIGASLLNLVSSNVISPQCFAAGLSEILEYAPDLHIDIPKLYDYLAFFIAPFIVHKHMDLLIITDLSEKIIAGNHGYLFLRSLINELRNLMGPSYVRLKWQDSGLELINWMNEDQALKFKEEKSNECLYGEVNLPETTKLSPQETQQKLFHLMSIDQSCECIKGWIRDHIGKASSEEWFMRMLIQAVCEYALFGSVAKQGPRFSQDRMSKYIHLINEYGDNKEARDANCLLGVQQLVHRLEHPQGVTLDIFQYLSDLYIIQREGFLAFGKSELEPEGKGVMMKALVSFFTNINEVDNEDSCSED